MLSIIIQSILCVLILILIVVVYRNPITADKSIKALKAKNKKLTSDLELLRVSSEVTQNDMEFCVERLNTYTEAVAKVELLCNRYRFYANRMKDDLIVEIKAALEKTKWGGRTCQKLKVLVK